MHGWRTRRELHRQHCQTNETSQPEYTCGGAANGRSGAHAVLVHFTVHHFSAGAPDHPEPPPRLASMMR
jgi:hypothetical protein